MDTDKLNAFLKTLVSTGIAMAETIHPMSCSGHQKLSTATTIIQTALGIAAASGFLPAVAINAIDVAAHVNQAVADANAAGGVPTLTAPKP